MTWIANAREPVSVRASTRSEVVDFARRECERYLEAITGRPASGGPGGSAVELRLAPSRELSDEGYRFLPSGQTLRIEAGGELGLVFGVFGFLRALGCRFSGLGPDGEHVPRLERLVIEGGGRAIEPLMAYRALQFAYLEPIDRERARLDWMVRNGLNFVTYRVFEQGAGHVDIDPRSGEPIIAGEGVGGKMSDEHFERFLLPEIRKRGLKLDFGHHNLLYWVPPSKHLASHPEWFAQHDGVRGKVFTQLALCTSEPGAVEELIASIRRYLRLHRDVRILGVIPEDGINMCQCERCIATDDDPGDAFRVYKGHLDPAMHNQSKSRRYALLLNTVARALRGEFPNVLIGGAAYADLQWPAEGVELDSNITLWLAVYWRDGARPLFAAGTSKVNRFFAGLTGQWHARVGPRLSLYEYYMGMNAQASLPYPMSRVILEDWAELQKLGLFGATVQCLSSVHDAYALNLLAFARCGWERDVDHEALLTEFLEGMFGEAGPSVRPIYDAMLRAMDELAARPADRAETAPPEVPLAVLMPDARNVCYFMRYASAELVKRCLAEARRTAATPRAKRQLDRFQHYLAYCRLAAEHIAATSPDAAGKAGELPPLESLLDLLRHEHSGGWTSPTHAANWRRLHTQHSAKPAEAKR